MNEIKVFENDAFGSVRTIDREGDVWFVGKDVATALGYSNTNDALSRHVDPEDKYQGEGVAFPDPHGTLQYPTIINESGLYSLVLSSKLPTARQFKRWITKEVIPSIRKTGGYFATPKTYVEALRALADAEEEKERLALENEEMKPKAEFYDTVAESSTTFEVGVVAKILNFGIGRNKLFKFLRNEGILNPDNIPYQQYVDAGYFKVVEMPYGKLNGDTLVGKKTVVYQKGIDYIRKRLIKKGKVAQPQINTDTIE